MKPETVKADDGRVWGHNGRLVRQPYGECSLCGKNLNRTCRWVSRSGKYLTTLSRRCLECGPPKFGDVIDDGVYTWTLVPDRDGYTFTCCECGIGSVVPCWLAWRSDKAKIIRRCINCTPTPRAKKTDDDGCEDYNSGPLAPKRTMPTRYITEQEKTVTKAELDESLITHLAILHDNLTRHIDKRLSTLGTLIQDVSAKTAETPASPAPKKPTIKRGDWVRRANGSVNGMRKTGSMKVIKADDKYVMVQRGYSFPIGDVELLGGDWARKRGSRVRRFFGSRFVLAALSAALATWLSTSGIVSKAFDVLTSALGAER